MGKSPSVSESSVCGLKTALVCPLARAGPVQNWKSVRRHLAASYYS